MTKSSDPPPADVALTSNEAVYKLVAYLEGILSHLEVGVVLFGAGDPWRVIYANRTLADWYGVTQEALMAWSRETAYAHVAALTDDPSALRALECLLAAGLQDCTWTLALARPAPRTLRYVLRRIDVDREPVYLLQATAI